MPNYEKNLIKDFEDLEIYKLATELADFIYSITMNFPSEEKYNITAHLREASVSVGANIAEGYGRYHYKENIQFCRIARGSLAEVKHFMLFSKQRDYNKNKTLSDFLTKYQTLQIKLNNYIKSIGSKYSREANI